MPIIWFTFPHVVLKCEIQVTYTYTNSYTWEQRMCWRFHWEMIFKIMPWNICTKIRQYTFVLIHNILKVCTGLCELSVNIHCNLYVCCTSTSQTIFYYNFWISNMNFYFAKMHWLNIGWDFLLPPFSHED